VTAIGVMRGLAGMGLRVPEDISVMGYDNIPLSEYVLPSLTTVAQPIAAMGKKAVEVLLEHIKNPETVADKAVLPSELIVRESTIPLVT
jgi:DNA-binding LacI/PurR family transcriptional regulator